jgi:hypothetical protein
MEYFFHLICYKTDFQNGSPNNQKGRQTSTLLKSTKKFLVILAYMLNICEVKDETVNAHSIQILFGFQ